MKKTALVAVSLMLVGSALSVANAAPGGRRNAQTVEAIVVPNAPEVVGTVTYDTGVNVGFFPDATSGNLNRTVGNRFNSALGQPLLMTGMVSMITAFPAAAGTQSVSVAGPPNGAGVALVLAFINGNMMAGQFNSLAITANVGGDFLGIFLGAYNVTTAAGLAGMSDMETMGQGFHAFSGFYAAGNQTMVTPIPNRNAMVRATGNILVPVELMEFKIQ